MFKKHDNFDEQDLLDEEESLKQQEKSEAKKLKPKNPKKDLEQIEFKQKLVAPLILLISILISLIFYLLS